MLCLTQERRPEFLAKVKQVLKKIYKKFKGLLKTENVAFSSFRAIRVSLLRKQLRGTPDARLLTERGMLSTTTVFVIQEQIYLKLKSESSIDTNGSPLTSKLLFPSQ